eukprot:296256-Chlamydomonas_euryale.AAC.6
MHPRARACASAPAHAPAHAPARPRSARAPAHTPARMCMRSRSRARLATVQQQHIVVEQCVIAAELQRSSPPWLCLRVLECACVGGRERASARRRGCAGACGNGACTGVCAGAFIVDKCVFARARRTSRVSAAAFDDASGAARGAALPKAPALESPPALGPRCRRS